MRRWILIDNEFVLKIDFLEKNKTNQSKEIKYKINDNGCWICSSHKPDKWGYCNTSVKGKKYKIHRLVLENKLQRCLKPFPHEVTRHKCDNKQCINPNHLEAGTPQDNSNDAVKRNRSPVGERNGTAKINKKKVLEIKSLLLNTDYSLQEIADISKTSKSIVCKIKLYETWCHVRLDDESERKIQNKKLNYSLGSKNGNSTLTENDVINIKLLLKEGELTQKEIGDIYGVKGGIISKINVGRNWKHVN